VIIFEPLQYTDVGQSLGSAALKGYADFGARIGLLRRTYAAAKDE
jgi:hypothetical protein